MTWGIAGLLATIVILALVALALWIERNEWQDQTNAALDRLAKARKRHGEERVAWHERQSKIINAMLANFVTLQEQDREVARELAIAIIDQRRPGMLTVSPSPATVEYVREVHRELVRQERITPHGR